MSQCSAREAFGDFVAGSLRRLPEMTDVVVIACRLGAMSAVKSAAPNEHIRDIEPNEIQWNVDFFSLRFVQHDAGGNFRRPFKSHQADQILKCVPSIADIIDNHNGMTFDIAKSGMFKPHRPALFTFAIAAGMQKSIAIEIGFKMGFQIHQELNAPGQNPCQHNKLTESSLLDQEFVERFCHFGNPLLNHLPRNQKIPIGDLQSWPERHLVSCIQHALHRISLSYSCSQRTQSVQIVRLSYVFIQTSKELAQIDISRTIYQRITQ